MRGIEDPKTKLPELKNDGRMHVSLFGNYFEQNKVIIPNNNNEINIYCVYGLRQVNIPLIIEFAILNALFGAMEITKNANTSKYKYKGMVYVLIKVVHLVKALLTMEGTY